MMPGRTLHRVAKALCSVDIRERVIDALIADCQHEWLNAADSAGRVSAAARCWASFWISLAGCLAHDAQHDFARCAARVLKLVVPATVSLGSIFWPSWLETGQIDWIDAARRFAWLGALTAALFISAHRSQHAARRAWAPFFLAVGVAVAALVFHPVNDGHQETYEWVYMTSLTLAWPFLVRKKPGSVVEAPH